VTRLQSIQEQATAAREQAAAARAEAAVAAREAAAAAREQARAQTEMLRDRVQMARDMDQMRGDMVPVIDIGGQHGPSPRQEKMMFAGFIIVVLAAVAIFYPLMRAFARRLERGGRRAEAIDLGSAERLARIEQAVDAIAIEIERISEGQRFTTKLLTARADAPASLEH
jgi:flagellar biosynthesis/type III secretory pathway M-ring protein FliF/YscJ